MTTFIHALLMTTMVAGPWAEVAAHYESAYGLPPGLLQAICVRESGWRNVPGRDGEIGVCQVKPATVLKMGPAEDQVRIIQRALQATGYDPGPIDGIYGPRTTAAVRAFQRDHGLRVDGVVGPQTWRALVTADQAAEALWDPETNIRLAARYLAWLQARLGTDDPMILAAAYNGGPGHPIVRYMLSISRMVPAESPRRYF